MRKFHCITPLLILFTLSSLAADSPKPGASKMPHRKRVFFVSDRTGITVEALGSSLLTQFADLDFMRMTLPFIDSVDGRITGETTWMKLSPFPVEVRKM